ncbi:MAG: hypothetical protein M1834_000798 [Cirrosporium novae-zelandiae]|nr:MAG: hypothetical protein M1834_000798 [Cirrosporium novae-zelandiae]
MASPGHLAPGLWRHPDDRAKDYLDLNYWVELAKFLEEAKFHGVFFADVLGIYDVYHGPENIGPALKGPAQFPIADPSLLVGAMAYATKSLSFGVTASTTYESPYTLARKFSALDHLSHGRVGWNVVTSYLDHAAKCFGLDEQIPHDERYKRAEEFMEVTYKLWEGSWQDDAVIKDRENGVFTDPEKVRKINHKGKYFSCAGPNLIEPSPQRTPFIFQAGASSSGKAFAVRHAEAMFLPGTEPEKTKKVVDDIRKSNAEQGRDPSTLKLLAGLLVIIDETDEKAQAKYQEMLQYADLEGTGALFGGWTGTDLSAFADDEDFAFKKVGGIQSIIETWSRTIPGSKGIKWTKKRVLQEMAVSGIHAKVIGSPTTVADELQRWIDVSGVDGFNLSYAHSPGTFKDMVKYLWPELKKRGVLQEEYAVPGGTTRENYLGDGQGPRLRAGHPATAYVWKST